MCFGWQKTGLRRERIMDTTQHSAAVANLPVNELDEALRSFSTMLLRQLPEKRLREVESLAVQATNGAQSPPVNQGIRAR